MHTGRCPEWEAAEMNLPVGNPSRPEPTDAGAAAESGAAARRAATRRKLDDVFGDVLPDVTRDELDDGSDRPSGTTDRDQWYRDNRPPHHQE